MTTRQYFAARYVAQEARKQMRAGDHEYASGIIDTDQRPNPVDCRAADTPLPGASAVAAVGAPHTLTFVLPMPPSVNQLYRAGAGDDTFQRYLVPEQRMFRRTVCAIVTARMSTKLGRLPPLAGRIELTVTLYFANRRRTDLDNRFKSVLDALAHADAYHDDSQIDLIIAERVIRSGDEECTVILREIAA